VTFLQRSSDLPRVARVPAPWALHGHAWMVVMRLPARSAARRDFVDDELRSTLSAPVSLLMFVEYASAPCGPYRELLLIPGTMRFADNGRHASISRIVVSTWQSVVNGRLNWGIPKDRADLDIETHGDATRIVARDGEHAICEMVFRRPRGPRLPLDTRWLPSTWGTLAQRLEGQTFLYRPHARGTMRLCALEGLRVDPAAFPDVTTGRALAALRVEHFDMTFPVARTLPA